MKKVLFLLAVLFSFWPSLAAVNVPLTIQEALPIGTPGCSTAATCGVARTGEPFTVGVPLPDDPSTGASSISVLGLTGCTAGQFRILGTWPSGRIKWLEVSGIAPAMPAGGTASCTLTSTGSGNFGGSNLASDGSSITVTTGTSTYHVKKANFNLLDYVDVGSSHIVGASSAANRGLVLTGPTSPNMDCTNGCTTAYSSANDPNSNCLIEENGPVKTVLKCMGDLVDTNGHVYLHHTTRLTFWQNKDGVKAHIELRNADNNSTAFNRAYKGFASFEAKLDLATSGPNRYAFGGKTGAVSGNFSGSEDATLVQMYSKYLEGTGIGVWDTANLAENSTQSIIPRSSGGGCSDPYCYPNSSRSMEGYQIKDGSNVLDSGTRNDVPSGWCNVENGAGQGAMAGVWYLAAYWPKSCELDGGGNNIVVGIWPKQISGFNYWIAWPQYQIHDIFFDFHNSSLASNDTTFKSLQYNLIARPPLAQYNASGVLPAGMTLPDPTAEDNFYKSVATADGFSQTFACCVTDTSATSQAQTYRTYAWGQGSAANQAELRWANLLLFVSRGFTSRYIHANMFYRFVEEQALPRSDFAGGWRGIDSNVSITGFPNDASANSTMALRSWIDRLHAHVYGIFDYYFMTGDESIRDTISQGFSDWLLNTNLTNNASNGPQRAVGVYLMGVNHMHDYMLATGDAADPATGVKGSTEAWNNAELTLNSSIRPVMNTGGPFGNPCSRANCAGTGDYGTDAARGVTWPQGSWTAWDNPPAGGANNPGGAGTSRNTGQLQEGILLEGLMEYALNRGSSWPQFEDTMDLAVANGLFVRNELTVTGSPTLLNNGTRAGITLDYCNDPAPPCSAGTHNTWAVYFAPNAFYYTMAILHQYWGDTAWVQSFKDNLYQDYYSTGAASMSEQSIYSMAALVYRALNLSSAPQLIDVPISNFVDNGGGSYTVNWTVPTNAQSYKFKWGTKPLVTNMQFDPGQTLKYSVDPSTHQTWWTARNVSNEPAPASAGSTQSYTFVTGTTGLVAADFSLKAYLAGGTTGGSGTAANLISMGGSGQSGTVSQALGSPFSVEVTDAGGNPVSGVTVNFTVSAGGGSLTAGTAVTNSNGMASTTLVLGPAAGTNMVTATAGSLSGSPISFSATGLAGGSGAASKLIMVSGNGQNGITGQQLGSPFTVEVTDNSGNPVAGTVVTFSVTSGGGSLTVASTSSNSSGLASTTLTLGAAAGANAVSVSAGSLTGSPIVFSATSTAATQGGATSWTQQSVNGLWPDMVAWLKLPYDPVSQQTVFYIGPPNGSHGIYSTDIYTYSASANRFTHVIGTGSVVDACPVDTPIMPGDRHPEMMVTDTKRNVVWIFGGVNVFCGGGHVSTNGSSITYIDGAQFPADGTLTGKPITIGAGNYTVANVSDNTHLTITGNAGVQSSAMYSTPHGSSANPREDMYYLALNPDPTVDTFHQVFPGTIPAAYGYSGVAYDSDDDVIFMFGSDTSSQSHDNWVYCPTSGTATPGTLTSRQTAAGCQRPDDWSEVKPVGGVQPNGVMYNGLLYDTLTKNVIMTGGMNGGLNTCYNETWSYDVPSKTWAQKALSGVVPPNFTSSICVSGSHVPHPSWAYNSVTHKILFHQNSDYNGAQPSDWQYDPAGDTWSEVTVGAGPAQDTFMAYDVGANRFVTLGQSTSNMTEIWQNTPTSSTGSSGAASMLVALSGNNQIGAVGQLLASAFTVQVTDSNGNPVAGTMVTFTVTAGGGNVTTTTVATNSSGLASSTLTLGLLAGLNTVTATASGLTGSPVTFNATSSNSNKCDINGDGTVTATDVQLAVNQVVGLSTCGSADLDSTGACTVLDVQRVIQALVAGTCKAN